MGLGVDFALMARLQTVLDKASDDRHLNEDPESFLEKVGEIAERNVSTTMRRLDW
jgi:hypothetical protein